MEDAVTISAYNTLRLLEPKRDIVLAIGTSVNLVFVGGPRPVLGRSGDHQRLVVSEDPNIAEATDVTQFNVLPAEDYTVVQVLCRKLGETEIKLMITNTPVAANCKGHTSSVTTKVTCGKPRKITLQPLLNVANTEACPMDLSSGNVVVQSSNNIDIEVTVYDDIGSKFLNISSFFLDWSLSNVGMAKVLNRDGAFPKNISIGSVEISNKHYQTLSPAVQIGKPTS